MKVSDPSLMLKSIQKCQYDPKPSTKLCCDNSNLDKLKPCKCYDKD